LGGQSSAKERAAVNAAADCSGRTPGVTRD
jgi:hypothetical protein